MPSALDATAFVSPHGRKDAFSPSRERVLSLCSSRGLESVSLTELAISPHHIDYMGHVGNAHYSTFMNVAHNRILLGVLAELADEKTAQDLAFAKTVALVPVRIATDFLLPVGFPDALITGGRFSSVSDKGISIAYELFSLKSAVRVAVVEVTSRFVDPKKGRAVSLSTLDAPWPALVEQLQARAKASGEKVAQANEEAKKKKTERIGDVDAIKKLEGRKAEWGKL